MSPYDVSTLAFYEAQAKHYLGSRPDDVSIELPAFLNCLTSGSSVLELGCGGGRDASYMIERGFIVKPTDGTPAMAAEASALLNCQVHVMRFDELDADAEYDAVIALASLLHVPLDALPATLGRVFRALKPGGWHLATYKTADTPAHDAHGRYYNYLPRDRAEAVYREAGDWSHLECEERHGEGWFSEPARWLTMIAQR